MVRACWLYFLGKFLEFTDTFFFLARKKYNHVSWLQIIHHTTMPLYGYVMVRWLPGGHETFGGTLNSLVHVFMYSYYFLATFGPGVQKYLWWKKYLTVFQMVQFVVVFTRSLIVIFGVVECGYPRYFSLISASITFLFFLMFMHFYTQSYTKKTQKINWINVLNHATLPWHTSLLFGFVYKTQNPIEYGGKEMVFALTWQFAYSNRLGTLESGLSFKVLLFSWISLLVSPSFEGVIGVKLKAHSFSYVISNGMTCVVLAWNYHQNVKNHSKSLILLHCERSELISIKNRKGVQSLMVMPIKLCRFEWSERGIWSWVN